MGREMGSKRKEMIRNKNKEGKRGQKKANKWAGEETKGGGREGYCWRNGKDLWRSGLLPSESNDSSKSSE